MTPVANVEGRAIRFDRANVDTDIIIPAKHLKTISRVGLGAHAFETVRRDPGNMFDDPTNAGATILIAGDNFGCGSSREHAVWALMDRGIRAVIAPSLSDIFAGNALRNGLVLAALPAAAVDRLMALDPATPIRVDLMSMTVTAGGFSAPFVLDEFARDSLIEGRDEIATTLRSVAAIATYEASAPQLAWTRAGPSASDHQSRVTA